MMGPRPDQASGLLFNRMATLGSIGGIVRIVRLPRATRWSESTMHQWILMAAMVLAIGVAEPTQPLAAEECLANWSEPVLAPPKEDLSRVVSSCRRLADH